MSLKLSLSCGFYATAHWQQVSQGAAWTMRAKSRSISEPEALLRHMPIQVPIPRNPQAPNGGTANVLSAQYEFSPSIRSLWGVNKGEEAQGFTIGGGDQADLQVGHPLLEEQSFKFIGCGPDETPFRLFNLSAGSSLCLLRGQQRYAVPTEGPLLLASGDFVIFEPGIFWVRVTIAEAESDATISIV